MSDSRVTRRRAQRARVARSIIVPDFPEIVQRGTQCRLCGLVETDPELLRRIHAMWREGKGVRALATSTVADWAERKLKAVDHRTFDRHFKNHVDFDDTTTAVGEVLAEDIPSTAIAERPRALSPVGILPPAPPPRVELAKPRPEDQEAGAGDYFDMENVIRRLRVRLEQIDQDTSFVDDDGRVNTYGIVIWLKLISEMRQALEALNRMKNSDRLTKAILQAHTKRFAQILSAPLIARFESMLAFVQRGDNSGALAEIERLTRGGQMKEIVLRAADEAVRESVTAYKLH